MDAGAPTDEAVGENVDDLATLHPRVLDDAPTELVDIGLLVAADSPRVAGEDMDHAHLLAETTGLPPIVVHRATMRVVDGMHRVRAAMLRGERYIEARYFDGTEEEAFIFSVVINTKHGLPLSRADRVASAERILAANPQWSDRAVAAFTGISAKKVSKIRRQLADHATEAHSRIGRDGRRRPVNSAQGRERASELMRENPSASLREIARAAGISPATAADVRDRVRRGVDPVPNRSHAGGKGKDAGVPGAVPRADRAKPLYHLMGAFEKLRKDPALRFSETGRAMLRMVDICLTASRDKKRIIETMPAHCVEPMAELLHTLAEVCRSFGDELERSQDAEGA